MRLRFRAAVILPYNALRSDIQACASMVTEKSLNQYVRLYPRLKEIRELSVRIAIDVSAFLYSVRLIGKS